MQKDDTVYVKHMLESARQITDMLAGLSRQDYDDDAKLRLALIHLTQIIGEAARRVSIETQQKFPDISWRHIIGMRHKIVHDYMVVDEDIVWNAVTVDVPSLIAMLEPFFDEEKPNAT